MVRSLTYRTFHLRSLLEATADETETAIDEDDRLGRRLRALRSRLTGGAQSH